MQLLPWHDLDFTQAQLITALYQSRSGDYFLADNLHRLLVLREEGDQLQLIRSIDNIGECTAFTELGDSILLVTTSKGLLSIDQNNLQSRMLNEEQDGLPNEHFFCALPDREGKLWLTSHNGLYRYDLSTKNMHRFGKADGLQAQGFAPRLTARPRTERSGSAETMA